MEHVAQSITILRPRAEIFHTWRELEPLPHFMHHLTEVRVTAPGESRWVARTVNGKEVAWTAEIVEEERNEFIRWRTLEGDLPPMSGEVRFTDAPGDRGTVVQVTFTFDPAHGGLDAKIAHMFGEDPVQQVRDDLRRFKQAMETGEVTLSDGSPEGAGLGANSKRPAQPSGQARRASTQGAS